MPKTKNFRPAYNRQINKVCVENGLSGSGEITNAFVIYHKELHNIYYNNPKLFLQMLMQVKTAKYHDQFEQDMS